MQLLPWLTPWLCHYFVRVCISVCMYLVYIIAHNVDAYRYRPPVHDGRTSSMSAAAIQLKCFFRIRRAAKIRFCGHDSVMSMS